MESSTDESSGMPHAGSEPSLTERLQSEGAPPDVQTSASTQPGHRLHAGRPAPAALASARGHL